MTKIVTLERTNVARKLETLPWITFPEMPEELERAAARLRMLLECATEEDETLRSPDYDSDEDGVCEPFGEDEREFWRGLMDNLNARAVRARMQGVVS